MMKFDQPINCRMKPCKYCKKWINEADHQQSLDHILNCEERKKFIKEKLKALKNAR